MTQFFWEPEALPALKLKEHLLALICVLGRQFTLLLLVWSGLVWSRDFPGTDNPIEWTHSQPLLFVMLLLCGKLLSFAGGLVFPLRL